MGNKMKYIIRKNIDLNRQEIFNTDSFMNDLSVLYLCNYRPDSTFEKHFHLQAYVQWSGFVESETAAYFAGETRFKITRELSVSIMAEEVKKKRINGAFAEYTITTWRLAKEIISIMADSLMNGQGIEDKEINDVIHCYNGKLKEKNFIDEWGIMQSYMYILKDEKYIASILKRYKRVVIYGGERADPVQVKLALLLSQNHTEICWIAAPHRLITVNDIEKNRKARADINEFCVYHEAYEMTQNNLQDVEKIEGSILRNDMLDRVIIDIQSILKDYPAHEIGILTTYADDTLKSYLSKKGINCGRDNDFIYRNAVIRGITAILDRNAEQTDLEGLYGYMAAMGIPFEEIKTHAKRIEKDNDNDPVSLGESMTNAIIQLVERTDDPEKRKYAGGQVSKIMRLTREIDHFYQEETLYQKAEHMRAYILNGETFRKEGSLFFDKNRIALITPFDLIGRSESYKVIMVLSANSKNWVRPGGNIFNKRTDEADLSLCYRNLAGIIYDNTKEKLRIYNCDINNEGWRNEGNFDEILERWGRREAWDES